MAQYLVKVHLHIIFSTKNGVPFLSDQYSSESHSYMAMVAENFKCHAVLINSVKDHLYLLVQLHRTVTISKAT